MWSLLLLMIFASATVYFAPIEYILNAIRNTRASQKKTGGLYCVTTGGAIGCAFRCNYHAGIWSAYGNHYSYVQFQTWSAGLIWFCQFLSLSYRKCLKNSISPYWVFCISVNPTGIFMGLVMMGMAWFICAAYHGCCILNPQPPLFEKW